ncbi:hypothetical protein BU17DRAFT_96904 [Hysterangium stoloniferum]|nr:hypothetical protein BU17DRAFT_96904 [Hysterangium stoloniferum]
MPALTLPPSFSNAFWSQEYRRGLETLYGKLQQGVDENLEVYSFIKARALAENDIANALLGSATIGTQGKGFDADDGATLVMTFRALQSESHKQGEAHRAVAQELVSLVADPFGEWASGHAARITESQKSILDGWLKAYELAVGDVDKLKHAYLTKMRRADEAEDDAKFAPGRNAGDNYTAVTSPKLGPTPTRAAKRTASVSERISQRFKELRKGIEKKDDESDEKNHLSLASPVFSAGKSDGDEQNEDDTNDIPYKDKGKGKEVASPAPMVSPTTMSPPSLNPPLPDLQHPAPTVSVPKSASPIPLPTPISLAGLSLPPQAVSQLLTRAASELPLRTIRFAILGDYPDCFSGEAFVVWLKDNVQGFGGSLDRAEDAAVELTEREGALRRIGEFGNRFESSEDAFYQFKPKAFEFHFTPDSELYEQQNALSPVAENLMKRTSNLVSIVQKAVTAASNAEPLHIRARHDAEDADKVYRVAVRKLDRQRLGLEEKIEDTLKTLQRWETERLRAVKTALLQYQGTLKNLPTAISTSLERASVALSSYQPDNDLIALIERYRTGPFRPTPHLYESILHDRPDSVFGIDLRKWAGEGGWNALRANEEQKELDKLDLVPQVVRGLLSGMNEGYKRLPNDVERRKAWIYEVPLPAVHHLREAINTLPPDATLPSDLLAKYDAPVIASTLKLWMLELDPPLSLWEGWDDVRKLYPSVGAVAGAEVPEQQRVEDLQVTLVKLPKIHLLVLDAVIEHLKHLIDTTQTEESTEVYTTKLALSLGRTILRPKYETEMSIQERHPTLLFIDLVKHYTEILPKTISRKKRESLERPIPTRKRTKMVDQRLSRSRISIGSDPRQLLAAQQAAQYGPPSRGTSPAPPSVPRPISPPPTGAPPAPAASQESSDPIIAPPVAPPTPDEPTPLPAETYVPPPRPQFMEQAPSGGYAPPPRPTFIEPTSESGNNDNVVVSPPTPVRPQSPDSPPLRHRPASLASKVSLKRTGSGEASRVRGPRVVQRSSRGAAPTPLSGASGRPITRTSLVSPRPLHARNPPSTSLTPEQAREYAPKKHVGKANAALFSRRTVASDAEDNILDK